MSVIDVARVHSGPLLISDALAKVVFGEAGEVGVQQPGIVVVQGHS